MVSIYKTENVKLTLEGKKATLDNGSSFIEIDTGKLFLYDLDSQTWNEV